MHENQENLTGLNEFPDYTHPDYAKKMYAVYGKLFRDLEIFPDKTLFRITHIRIRRFLLYVVPLHSFTPGFAYFFFKSFEYIESVNKMMKALFHENWTYLN